jgi:hypothetical protein
MISNIDGFEFSRRVTPEESAKFYNTVMNALTPKPQDKTTHLEDIILEELRSIRDSIDVYPCRSWTGIHV